ncbi:MAG TPA: response regulator transcription factor [bacterium]|nr:response regulator transcription factor [bacterium]
MSTVPALGPAEAGPTGRYVRVLLLSRTALVRVALRQLLSGDGGVAVVAEAGSWSEAVAAAGRSSPDIMLVDMHDHAMVLDRLPELQAATPGARVIVLSDDPEAGDLFAAARAGVWGYLPHDVTSGELLRAVRTVAQGRVAVGGTMSREDFARLGAIGRGPDAPLVLSPTEARVIRVMSEGHTDGQIAAQLGMSVPTVKTHVRAILRKTSARNRAAAIAAAFRSGLLS